MNPLKKQNSFEQKLRENIDGMEFKPSDALWDKIAQNMGTDTFEPKLQEKLANFTVEPTQETWDKVESQLPENKRRFGWIWYASILALAFTLIGYNYYKSPTTLVSKEMSKLEECFEPSSPTSNGPTTQANVKTNKQLPAKVETDIEVEPIRENKLTAQNSKETKPLQTETKTPEPSMPVSPKRKNGGSGNSSLPPIEPIFSSPTSENSKNSNSIVASKKEDAANTSSPTEPPAAKSPEIKQENSQAQGKEISALVQNNAKDSSEPILVTNTKEYLESDAAPTNFSLLAVLGTHMSYMTLAMPETKKYDLEKAFNLRQEIEAPQLDFSGGLQAEYAFTKKWYMRAGIGIVSFTQKVQYNILPVDTAMNQVQAPNSYLHKQDSIIVGSTYALENKYSLTEFPIYVGYNIANNEDWNIDLNVGMSYGRLNLVNAYMPDPSCVGLLIASDKNAFPQFKNVWFANIAPSVSWNINARASVGLMPHLRLGLNNMVDNQDWISQKPWSAGLNLFLRKRF
jgi:hypothetical protein